LRERINDIAAEIARLTVALDGVDSPIEAMLTSEAGHDPTRRAPANGEHAAAGPPAKAKGSLADRIRAPPAQSLARSPQQLKSFGHCTARDPSS